MRSFIGPDRGIPENVNKHKTLASIRRVWRVSSAANLLVVPKEQIYRRKETGKNSRILKDGFVIVNFKDITVINNDDFNA